MKLNCKLNNWESLSPVVCLFACLTSCLFSIHGVMLCHMCTVCLFVCLSRQNFCEYFCSWLTSVGANDVAELSFLRGRRRRVGVELERRHVGRPQRRQVGWLRHVGRPQRRRSDAVAISVTLRRDAVTRTTHRLRVIRPRPVKVRAWPWDWRQGQSFFSMTLIFDRRR